MEFCAGNRIPFYVFSKEELGNLQGDFSASPFVESVAGVDNVCERAAVLGAPLGHDFCVISLSDLLTPWEQIEKRLKGR